MNEKVTQFRISFNAEELYVLKSLLANEQSRDGITASLKISKALLKKSSNNFIIKAQKEPAREQSSLSRLDLLISKSINKTITDSESQELNNLINLETTVADFNL